MKNPCPLCESRKAQRRCKRQNNAEICSLCCAKIRNETCAGCSHYATAQQYGATRSPAARRPGGHFISEADARVETAVDSALELAQRGKTNEAWTLLARLTAEHPDDRYVCYGMGTMHAISGQLKESVNWFDKAIAASPHFVEAHFNKALSHEKLLEVGESIHAYRKVLEFADPGEMPAKQAKSFLDSMDAFIRQSHGVDLDYYLDSKSEFDRAFKLMERTDWAGALAGFRASAAMIERNATLHGNMGLCLAHLGHKAQALAEFDRALEIDPTYAVAITNRVGVENMEEGFPLESRGIKVVNYSREKVLAESRERE
ncbi:tetratricopeptide repeat protein [Massilia glaciei]|uniref:Tetratricopeptide repeat protein n=1 Tax=Massilia glaciei TaxID=1524097 RepID=A0A2U2I7N3_9BURK|nr:tetratricopeptide repeat protein [Massilia glaciei]PWF55773.1 tetratricopeptide repeat protein [Massilia glaciei]